MKLAAHYRWVDYLLRVISRKMKLVFRCRRLIMGQHWQRLNEIRGQQMPQIDTCMASQFEHWSGRQLVCAVCGIRTRWPFYTETHSVQAIEAFHSKNRFVNVNFSCGQWLVEIPFVGWGVVDTAAATDTNFKSTLPINIGRSNRSGNSNKSLFIFGILCQVINSVLISTLSRCGRGGRCRMW